MLYRLGLATAFGLLTASPALAHLDPSEHGSFAAGFTHPLFGTDHVLAMIAVGLWAALLGGRAVWALPTAFVGAMIVGFLLSLAGVPLPYVEPFILTSVVVLGVVVALALRLPLGVCAALVGVFGICHGVATRNDPAWAPRIIRSLGVLTALGGLYLAAA